MRIVNKKTFLTLPENTLYCDFSPHLFGPLSIKLENRGDNDFYTVIIKANLKLDGEDDDLTAAFSDVLDRAMEKGESFEMDFYEGTADGMFDDKQLYAVWEDKDVAAFIARLRECIRSPVLKQA